MDFEVLGVLPNALGPKQDIILIELKGAKVEHSGVVAGMSGSPVYINGKLAGALSLKLGIFTKEAIAGVTPIENMLDIQKSLAPAMQVSTNAPGSAIPVSSGAPVRLGQTDEPSHASKTAIRIADHDCLNVINAPAVSPRG